MASISLDHVWKRYREVVAVRDLSLDVADGEFLVLIGPSGCGKTTVLRLIAGLEIPDAGEVLFDGRPVTRVSARGRNVAMVFESYALYPHLAVRENLDFAMRIHRTPEDEIERRVSAVTASMELGGLLERKPAALAAGQAQHVAVGRAVVREGPAAFLLDDALAHLDAAQRLEARAELGRIHRELRSTIVSVTHDQAEALAVGNRVAVMNGGVLEQVGTPRALYGMPASIFVAGFVGTPPMNLVEMTVEHHGDEVLLRSDGIALSIREPARSILDRSTGPAVTVGIRPEHLRVGEDPLPDEVTVRGVCDLVEFLGHHVLVHLRVGGLELRAFDDPAKQLRRGHVVDVGIPLDRLRLFDTATGRALDAWAPAPR